MEKSVLIDVQLEFQKSLDNLATSIDKMGKGINASITQGFNVGFAGIVDVLGKGLSKQVSASVSKGAKKGFKDLLEEAKISFNTINRLAGTIDFANTKGTKNAIKLLEDIEKLQKKIKREGAAATQFKPQAEIEFRKTIEGLHRKLEAYVNFTPELEKSAEMQKKALKGETNAANKLAQALEIAKDASSELAAANKRGSGLQFNTPANMLEATDALNGLKSAYRNLLKDAEASQEDIEDVAAALNDLAYRIDQVKASNKAGSKAMAEMNKEFDKATKAKFDENVRDMGIEVDFLTKEMNQFSAETEKATAESAKLEALLSRAANIDLKDMAGMAEATKILSKLKTTLFALKGDSTASEASIKSTTNAVNLLSARMESVKKASSQASAAMSEMVSKSKAAAQEAFKIKNLFDRAGSIDLLSEAGIAQAKKDLVELGGYLKKLRSAKIIDEDEIKRTTAAFNGLKEKIAGATKKTDTFSAAVKINDSLLTKWWKTFGKVALGFTVAYRAMNVIEEGFYSTGQLIKEAITDSGELAGLQAELATYYSLASGSFDDYAENVKRASVYTTELWKASLKSMSTIEELAIGFSEISQRGIFIEPELIDEFAAVNDAIIQIAKSTGDNAKQVRSEWGGLLDGTERATNAFLIFLKNANLLTADQIDQLKNLKTTGDIVRSILRDAGEGFKEFQAQLLLSKPDQAFQKWRDTLKSGLTLAIQDLNDEAESSNIFADIFVKHITNLQKVFSDQTAINEFKGGIKALAELLDSALTLVEDFVLGLVKFSSWITQNKDAIISLLEAIGGFVILKEVISMVSNTTRGLGSLWKAFSDPKGNLLTAIVNLSSFSTIAVMSVGTVNSLHQSIKSLYTIMANEAMLKETIASINNYSMLINIAKDNIINLEKEIGNANATDKQIEKLNKAEEAVTKYTAIIEKLKKTIPELQGEIEEAAKDPKTKAIEAFFKPYEEVLKLTVKTIKEYSPKIAEELKKVFNFKDVVIDDVAGTKTNYEPFGDIVKKAEKDAKALEKVYDDLLKETTSFYADFETAVDTGNTKVLGSLGVLSKMEIGLEIDELNKKIDDYNKAFMGLSEGEQVEAAEKFNLVINSLANQIAALQVELDNIDSGPATAELNALVNAFDTKVLELKLHFANDLSGKGLEKAITALKGEYKSKMLKALENLGSAVTDKQKELIVGFIEGITEEGKKVHKEAAEEIETIWENTRDTIQNSIAGFFSNLNSGEFESFSDMLSGFADSAGDVFATNFSQSLMEGLENSQFGRDFELFFGAIFKDFDGDEIAAGMLGTISAGIKAVQSKNPYAMGGAALGAVLGAVITRSPQGVAAGASIGGTAGSMIGGDEPSYGEQFGDAIDSLIAELKLNTAAVETNTKEMVSGTEFTFKALSEKYLEAGILIKEVFDGKTVAQRASLPPIFDAGEMATLVNSVFNKIVDQTALKTDQYSGNFEFANKEDSLQFKWGDQKANAEELDNIFTQLFSKWKESGKDIFEIYDLFKTVSEGDITPLINEIKKLDGIELTIDEDFGMSVDDFWQGVIDSLNAGSTSEANQDMANAVIGVFEGAFAESANEISAIAIQFKSDLEQFASEYEFEFDEEIFGDMFQVPKTAFEKSMADFHKTFGDGINNAFDDIGGDLTYKVNEIIKMIQIDPGVSEDVMKATGAWQALIDAGYNLASMTEEEIVKLDPRIKELFEYYDRAVDTVKQGIKDYYEAQQKLISDDMKHDLDIASGKFSTLDLALQDIAKSGKDYYDSLIDNGAVEKEARKATDEWTASMQGFAIEAQKNTDLDALNLRILQATGDETAILTMQRVKERKAIFDMYGTIDGGLSAAGLEVYNLWEHAIGVEDSAKEAAKAEEKLAAAREKEIAATNKMIADDKTIAGAWMDFFDVIGKEIDPSLFLQSLGFGGAEKDLLAMLEPLTDQEVNDSLDILSQKLRDGAISSSQFTAMTNKMFENFKELNPEIEDATKALEDMAEAARKTNQESVDWYNSFFERVPDNPLEETFFDIEDTMQGFRDEIIAAGHVVAAGWGPGGTVETTLKNLARAKGIAEVRSGIDETINAPVRPDDFFGSGFFDITEVVTEWTEDLKLWALTTDEAAAQILKIRDKEKQSLDKIYASESSKQADLEETLKNIPHMLAAGWTESEINVFIQELTDNLDSWQAKMPDLINAIESTADAEIKAVNDLTVSTEDLTKIRNYELQKIKELRDAYKSDTISEMLSSVTGSFTKEALRFMQQVDEIKLGFSDSPELGGMLELANLYNTFNKMNISGIDTLDEIIESGKIIDQIITTYADIMELTPEQKLAMLDAAAQDRQTLIDGLDDTEKEVESQVEALTKQYQRIIRDSGLTDYQKQLFALQDTHEDRIQQLKDENAYLGKNGELTAVAALELQAFNVEIADLKKSLSEGILDAADYKIATKGMSDYQKAVHDINAQYTKDIALLKSMGLDTSALTEAWGIDLIDAFNNALEPIKTSTDEWFKTRGLTDYGVELLNVNKTLEEGQAVLRDLGIEGGGAWQRLQEMTDAQKEAVSSSLSTDITDYVSGFAKETETLVGKINDAKNQFKYYTKAAIELGWSEEELKSIREDEENVVALLTKAHEDLVSGLKTEIKDIADSYKPATDEISSTFATINGLVDSFVDKLPSDVEFESLIGMTPDEVKSGMFSDYISGVLSDIITETNDAIFDATSTAMEKQNKWYIDQMGAIDEFAKSGFADLAQIQAARDAIDILQSIRVKDILTNTIDLQLLTEQLADITGAYKPAADVVTETLKDIKEKIWDFVDGLPEGVGFSALSGGLSPDQVISQMSKDAIGVMAEDLFTSFTDEIFESMATPLEKITKWYEDQFSAISLMFDSGYLDPVTYNELIGKLGEVRDLRIDALEEEIKDITSILEAADYTVLTSGMSEYQKALFDVNKSYGESAKILEEVDPSQLEAGSNFMKAWGIEVGNVSKSLGDAIDNYVGGFGDNTQTLSEKIADVRKEFSGYIKEAKLLGWSEAEIADIRADEVKVIKILNDEQEKLIQSYKESAATLIGSFEPATNEVSTALKSIEKDIKDFIDGLEEGVTFEDVAGMTESDAISKMKTDYAGGLLTGIYDKIFEATATEFEKENKRFADEMAGINLIGQEFGTDSTIYQELKTAALEYHNIQMAALNDEIGIAEELAAKIKELNEEFKSLEQSIAGDIFDALANDITKEEYRYQTQLEEIMKFAGTEGLDPGRLENLIGMAERLHQIRLDSFDEEINTSEELKDLYAGLRSDIESLQSSISGRLKDIEKGKDVEAYWNKLWNRWDNLDENSTSYYEDAVEILQDQLGTLDDIFNLEVENQRELLNAQKESLEGQINALGMINDALWELTGGNLAPAQSAAGFNFQYQKLLAEAKESGDPSDFLAFAKGEYLDFFSDFGGNYQDVNAMVVQDVLKLGDIISGGATLDDLNAQLVAVNNKLESIDNITSVGGKTEQQWLNLISSNAEMINSQIQAPIDNATTAIETLNTELLDFMLSIDRLSDAIIEMPLSDKAANDYNGLSVVGGTDYSQQDLQSISVNTIQDVKAITDALTQSIIAAIQTSDAPVNINLNVDGKTLSKVIASRIKSGDPEIIQMIQKVA